MSASERDGEWRGKICDLKKKIKKQKTNGVAQLLTLIVFINDEHSTVTKTATSRCVRAHNVAAFDILRNRGRHVHRLRWLW